MNRSILHVIASLEGGGAERQLALLALEQARRGWRVGIALRRRGPNEVPVEIFELGDHAGASPRLLVQLARLVRGFEIVQTWLPQMDVHGGTAALLRGVPWLMTERSSDAAYLGNAANRARRWLGQRANAVVANSQAGAAMWPGAIVIPNAVAVSPLARAPREPLFVFAGRLVEAKGPRLFVEAVARARARAIVFGEGPLRAQLAADIARLGAEVTLAGYRGDWIRELATATALVSPSRVEGEPNVILEAMAAGCPIIASDIPAHRALLDAKWLVPLDAESLAARMRAPQPQPSYVLGDRTIGAIADRYEQVYARAR